jgi:hypothetical protein
MYACPIALRAYRRRAGGIGFSIAKHRGGFFLSLSP